MTICLVGDNGTGYHTLSFWFWKYNIPITFAPDDDTDILVFVFSLSRVGTFHHLPKLWKKYASTCDTYVLVGNKLDLPRLVSSNEAQHWADTHDAHYIECSALNGENVKLLIDLCTDMFE